MHYSIDRQVVFLVTCLLLGLVLSGCVTTAEQGRRMEYRIESLEVRFQEEREEREERLAALESQVLQLSDSLEDLGVVARRSTADVGVTLESLQEEIRSLRGQIDELGYQLERGRDDQVRYKETLDRRVAGIEGEAAVAELEARQAAGQIKRPDEPDPFLDMAKEKLESGEYAVARNLLLDFQRRWPSHARFDESQFLIAESYFLAEDHRSAILEFNKIRERHQDSRFMPKSLVRLGESFAELRLNREASDFFDAVVRAYPDHPAAAEAREKKRALKSRR